MNNPLSISSFCENDHDELDKIFQEYLNYKHSDLISARKRLVEFRSHLQRHMFLEEEILFPLFETNSCITKGYTRLMQEEHQRIRQLLKAADRWETLNNHAENTLIITLGQHHLKEESVIFPTLDRSLTQEEKITLLQKLNKLFGCEDVELESCKESSFPLILPIATDKEIENG
jgi:iron-sulfur cluster repair protein YtfE (RIC family)